jgi:hypothetical protein
MRVLAVLLGLAAAASLREASQMNPIRRVVNILQKMQKEIRTEGEKDEELSAKFQCYCKTGAGKLNAAIEEEMAEAAEKAAAQKELAARVSQLEAEVKQHKKDREDAKASKEEATTIREKERKTFEKASADQSTNVGALEKAIPILEKGMGKTSFLQAHVNVMAIQRAADMTQGISAVERNTILSFLASPYGDYQASSGEIVGILKAMHDEMTKDLKDVIEAEKVAQKNYEELMAAKDAEIAAATKSIEEKSVKAGEDKVAMTEAKNAAANAEAEAEENRKFMANLGENCAKEKAEYEERQKERAQELVAVSEAIKILSDDDALDVFKKTLTSPETPLGGAGASFMQTVMDPKEAARKEAVGIVKGVVSVSMKPQRLSLLAYMLQTGKVDFTKVLKMIDDMIGVLNKEMADDVEQLNWCKSEFDRTGDEKKSTERDIRDLNKEIDELDARIAQLTEEMKTLKQEMEDAAKQAAEATELRKSEHAEFQENKAALHAATQLINKAKNRLNKFYNPAMYKPPPPQELSEEERIAQNMGETIQPKQQEMIAGTNIAVNFAQKLDIGEAPETGSYKKKSGKSQGVVGLMDMLIKELDTEKQTIEQDEKVAQRDYEQLMADTKEQTEANQKSLVQKEGERAESETRLGDAKTARSDKNSALEALNEEVQSLHASCDFLLENFDFRKQARGQEIEGLKNAKAVLSGADYSAAPEKAEE